MSLHATIVANECKEIVGKSISFNKVISVVAALSYISNY